MHFLAQQENMEYMFAVLSRMTPHNSRKRMLVKGLRGMTPLHHFCKTINSSFIIRIFHYVLVTDLNICDNFGNNCLHVAAQRNVDAVDTLIPYVTELPDLVSHANEFGRTPIMDCCVHTPRAFLKLLEVTPQEVLNVHDRFYWSLLDLVAVFCPQYCRELESYIPANTRSSKLNTTPIRVNKKVNVPGHLKNYWKEEVEGGMTPLHWLAIFHPEEIPNYAPSIAEMNACLPMSGRRFLDFLPKYWNPTIHWLVNTHTNWTCTQAQDYIQSLGQDECPRLQTCTICYSNLSQMAVLDPCGHSFCRQCCEKLNTCPVCRSPFNKAIALYLH